MAPMRGSGSVELKTPGIGKTSAIIAAIAFILSAQTLTRNQAWESETSLWSNISFLSLNKARPRYNLGNAYNDASATDMAITEYKEAVRLRPSYKEAIYNLGTIYHRHGDIDSAIKEYKKAIEIAPSFYLALNNLGYAYFEKGLFKEAINEYKKALEFSPRRP